MALPVTISGVAIPSVTDGYHLGPFIDGNGNVYVVTLDSADNSIIEVWKNTDPDSNSFAEQDSSNKPDNANNYTSLWAYQNGTKLKIVSQVNTTGSRAVEYHEFGMSDDGSADTWITTHEAVASVDAHVASYGVSIDVRSDGDRIVFHQGPAENVKGTRYARAVYSRWESSTWTTNIAVGATGSAVSHSGMSISSGASDKKYFAWVQSPTDLYSRSLDSSNTLGTSRLVGSSRTIAGRKGAYYDDSGTERVRFPLIGSFTTGRVLRIDSDGVPAETDFSDSTPRAWTCIAVDPADGVLHALYADTSTNDLWHDEAASPHTSWGTDTELLDAVTVNNLSGNIYTRSGAVVFGYLYDDGGTIKYNEYVITAGADVLSPSAIASAESFGTLKLNSTVLPSAVASGESFGTLSVADVINATAVTTAESFGTLQLNASILPSPAWTGETFGTLILVGQIVPSAITSLESFGTASLVASLLPSAITSGESFGTLQLNSTVFPSAVSSGESFGTALLIASILPTAIASAESFGTATLSGAATIIPSAVSTGESFGTATLLATIVPSAVSSAESFGSPTISFVEYITPSGIATGESFGTLQLNSTLFPSSAHAGETFGTATLLATIFPSAITSGESFGSATLLGVISPTGISTGEVFGTLMMLATIAASQVSTGESFGTLALQSLIFPDGVSSGESFGSTSLNESGRILPSEIARGESFGDLLLLAFIEPTAIGSQESIGTLRIITPTVGGRWGAGSVVYPLFSSGSVIQFGFSSGDISYPGFQAGEANS